MSGYIKKKVDVNQYSFMPICYEDVIAEDNPVGVLDAFVDVLDMEKLNFTRAKADT